MTSTTTSKGKPKFSPRPLDFITAWELLWLERKFAKAWRRRMK